ncbi:PEBP-like protein [Nemania serpens]|nr:PEBP-like protein [Nemania serpens]
MLSQSLIALAVSGALAATPPGFKPGSKNTLLVTYGNVPALDGAVVAKDITQVAPKIATQAKLDGTSFAVLMIDLDIPTDSPPQTNTLLHWAQTGLTQSNTTFALSVPDDEAAFAAYLGPAPPAKIPLSHRYTEIIIDTSDASEEGLDALKAATVNRLGFDAEGVLLSAGLADKVVAGNFFNVTNPGPLSGSPTSNSTSGGGNGTNPETSPTPVPLPVPAAAVSQSVSVSLLATIMIGVAFVAL